MRGCIFLSKKDLHFALRLGDGEEADRSKIGIGNGVEGGFGLFSIKESKSDAGGMFETESASAKVYVTLECDLV